MYIKYTTTTTISEGPTRFDLRGVTLRRAGHHGQARNIVSSFLSRVLPFPASRPTSSGLYMCMAPPSTEEIANRRLGCSRGRAGVWPGWHRWGWLGAQKATGWACPAIIGRHWWGGCPQVGPRGARAQKLGPSRGRAKRYAQYVFVDMSALKRNMFGHVR